MVRLSFRSLKDLSCLLTYNSVMSIVASAGFVLFFKTELAFSRTFFMREQFRILGYPITHPIRCTKKLFKLVSFPRTLHVD